MDARYALFIWGSYAVGLLALAWNLWSAWTGRAALRRRLADAREDAAGDGDRDAG